MRAATLTTDDVALEHLHALLVALDHLHMHLDLVAGPKVGDVGTKGLAVDKIGGLHGTNSLTAVG